MRTTSRDPDLDLLLDRFHLESGARRESALDLCHRDIDPARATVWLREKGAGEREQPVSPSPLTVLGCHADERGPAGIDAPVLRTATGAPMSGRALRHPLPASPHLPRLGRAHPVSSHVLRHTAITAVGRLAGYPVAQAFAGHTPPSVTGRYLHASIAEVATAVATLTGEAHPLADSEALRRCGRR